MHSPKLIIKELIGMPEPTRRMSPRTQEFLLDLFERVSDTVLADLELVARDVAEDALEKGDMDTHMHYGNAFHLIKGERARRAGEHDVARL